MRAGVSIESVEAWLRSYARAWERADTVAVVDLFTEDATYRSHIFRPPHRGRAGIASYWERATSSQSDVQVRVGSPLLYRERVVAEWWATMHDADEGELTLPGTLLLHIDLSGRCRALREYWHLEPGASEPYDGWGVVAEGDAVRTRDHALAWARGYERAWSSGDADAVTKLFSEDVVYRSNPFREPRRGRAGVLAYTKEAFGTESDRNVRFGDPTATGAAAAIEYWTTMRDEGSDATLAGCDVLTFTPEGLCCDLRESWHMEPGRREPPPEWGA